MDFDGFRPHEFMHAVYSLTQTSWLDAAEMLNARMAAAAADRNANAFIV
jgi:hypothetical protein